MISSAHCLHRPPRFAHATPTNCSRESAASIKDRFADPNISPSEVAAEMGISLRYLQSLFTDRGSTCSHYISSLRLDHAAHLIERRTSMKTGQPLAEIAYACGFRDYTHFARGFRRRFGTTPGGVGAGAAGNGHARVPADIGQSKPVLYKAT
jgi:AraC family transcriptional regulator, positive regulator of tynA and feaB